MAYQTTSAVFRDADPTILPELISQVRGDIRARIAKLKSQDVTDFGFFGSSLGSFILYNCIGLKSPSYAGEYLTPVVTSHEVCGGFRAETAARSTRMVASAA